MSDVTITVRTNGPYKVVGPDARSWTRRDGRSSCPEGSAVALCRCGHSRNKPFCDATHKRVGFVADDTAPRAARRARGVRLKSDTNRAESGPSVSD